MTEKRKPVRRDNIVKRGNLWAFYIELSPDANGKRRKKWHSGYASRDEAETARDEERVRVKAGTYVEPSQETVAAFLTQWLTTITPTVRPSTLHSYGRNLNLHVIPRIGSVTLQQLDPGALNFLYASLLASGRADGDGGLSPRTVRYIHTICHRALKDAVRWKRIVANPADGADPPRMSASARPEMTVWSAEILARFLDLSRSSGDRYFAGWHLLATGGMRRGEALGLRWTDLDLDAGRASIRQTVIAVRHEVTFGAPKTAKGRRVVVLDAGTVAVLREHRKRQLEERLMMGAGWRDHDLVFAKVDGTPIHPERFSREFDRRIARWSLPRIRLHDLRHGWATMALQAGVNPKVVSERLGHAGIAITLDTYSHVSEPMQSGAADAVAALIASAGSSPVAERPTQRLEPLQP